MRTQKLNLSHPNIQQAQLANTQLQQIKGGNNQTTSVQTDFIVEEGLEGF